MLFIGVSHCILQWLKQIFALLNLLARLKKISTLQGLLMCRAMCQMLEMCIYKLLMLLILKLFNIVEMASLAIFLLGFYSLLMMDYLWIL